MVKSVPAAAPPLPSVMRRFRVEQDGAFAAAPECVTEAGLEATLAGVLAEATPVCEGAAWLAGRAAAAELCEPQPTARIEAAATTPPVSEFLTVPAVRVI